MQRVGTLLGVTRYLLYLRVYLENFYLYSYCRTRNVLVLVRVLAVYIIPLRTTYSRYLYLLRIYAQLCMANALILLCIIII